MLLLVRHGQTEENLQHVLQGHMPGTLTPLGQQQAIDLAARLASQPIDIILSSDLKRATDTAELIRQHLPQPNPPRVHTTTLLRERDWGTATGLVVDATHRIDIPPTAEPVPTMLLRAQHFLRLVQRHWSDRTVLAVSHGLFCRAIQAVHQGKTIAEIPRMDNAEVRTIDFAN